MKPARITRRLASLTSALVMALSACGFAQAGALRSAQLTGAAYPPIFSAIPARTLAQTGSLAGVAALVGAAADGIVRAMSLVDMSSFVQPASWSPESTASIRPATRPAVTATRSDSAVFGTVAIPFKKLAALKKLAPSLAEMNSGSAIGCAKGKCEAATAIKAAFTRTAQASIRDKLNAVNATVNHSIRYRRDIDTYGQPDYWAKPSETLSRQQGDCEDFAILKMAALNAEGVDLKDMAVVVLFDQKRRFYHAVLSVSVGGSRFILDNMRDEVLADTRLPDYQPLYSIANGKGYLHGSRVGTKQLAAAMPIEKVAPGEGVAF